jgi:hypothetical protein
MRLPRPRPTYDAHDEAQARSLIEQADGQNFKRGQDVEIAGGAVLILSDESGRRFRITVVSGAVTATAL